MKNILFLMAILCSINLNAQFKLTINGFRQIVN